jgi:nucleoside-diphosphate-sugar epimerase
MNTPHYFITGASGCIGHYLLEDLLQSTDAHLDCLLRNPAKLDARYHHHPRITIHKGSLDHIENHQELIQQCDTLVHIATAWHDDDYSMQINYHKTLEMIQYATEGCCNKIIYFSTASILGRDNKPNPDALKLGPMYIKSKYRAHEAMQKLTNTPPIYTVFPTLVMGGNSHIPYSHISGGIKDHQRYIKIARFLSAKGQFHFMHGQDIAAIVTHLITNNEEKKQYVLGQDKLSIKQGIQEISRACGNRVYWQFPLNNRFVVKLAKLLGVKFDPWGEYCALNHDQSYQVTDPGNFNRTNNFPTITDAVKDIEGVG